MSLAPPEEPAADAPARPRRRLAVWIVAPIAVLLVLFVGVLATRKPATDRVAESPLLGKQAPAVAGTTLDGADYDLGERQGRWVLVNFFASWCQPCQREHPELAAFAAEHAETGDAEVVSVVFNDDTDSVERFFAQRGGDWPVVLDDRTEIGLDYGVSGIPESYLVDPLGVVRVKIIGGVTRSGLDRLLAEATGAPTDGAGA